MNCLNSVYFTKRKTKRGRQAGQAGVQAGHIGRATNREAPATGPAHMAGQGPKRPRPRGRSGQGPGRAAGFARGGARRGKRPATTVVNRRRGREEGRGKVAKIEGSSP